MFPECLYKRNDYILHRLEKLRKKSIKIRAGRYLKWLANG